MQFSRSSNKKQASEKLISVEDLDSDSDSESTEEYALREIKSLRETKQKLQKEHKKLEMQIEGLQNDLRYVTTARELSNAAKISMGKKLASLFGNVLKDEEILDKIKELQKRYEDTENEAKNLEDQLAMAAVSSPLKIETSGITNNMISKEIEKIKREKQKVLEEISDTNNAIRILEANIKDESEKYEQFNSQYKEAAGEFYGREEELAEFIRTQSPSSFIRNFKNTFNTDLEPDVFIHNLVSSVKQKRSLLKNSTPDQRWYDSVSKEIEALKAEKRKLNQEIASIKAQVIPPFTYETADLVEIEKKEQKKRLKTLYSSMSEAAKILELDWVIPKTHKDLCKTITKLAAECDGNHMSSHTDPSVINALNRLKTKVDSVKKENDLLRQKLSNV